MEGPAIQGAVVCFRGQRTSVSVALSLDDWNTDLEKYKYQKILLSGSGEMTLERVPSVKCLSTSVRI